MIVWVDDELPPEAEAEDEVVGGDAGELVDDALEELVGGLRRGLVFVNLIETDQRYGHRKDARGFAGALGEIDVRLGGVLERMREDDLLVVAADHGVDIAHPGTDHTREYAPLLALTGAMLARRRAGAGLGGFRHDGPLADVSSAR